MSADIQQLRKRLKQKIDEMDDYELREIAQSEDSFFLWVKRALISLGIYIAHELIPKLWQWFIGLFS